MSKLKSNWHIIKWQEIVDSLASRLQIDKVLLLQIHHHKFRILSSNDKSKQNLISKSKNDILYPILHGKKEIHIPDIKKHPEQILNCREVKNGNSGFFARAIYNRNGELWGCIYCLHSNPINFNLHDIDLIFKAVELIEADLFNLSEITKHFGSKHIFQNTKNLLLQYEVNNLKSKIEKLKQSNAKIHRHLKANNIHLKKVENIAKLGHWSLDFTDYHLKWSDQLYQILNLEPQSIKADYESFLEYVHPEDRIRVKEAFLTAVKKNQTYQIEHRLLLDDNSIKYVSEHGIIEYDENQQPTCGFGIIFDITDRKKIELLLQDAKEKAEESDQLKTDFLHNVSHEIRTPLNGILGFIELLDKPNLSKIKQVEYINVIRNCGNSLAKIISDLLEISNLQNSNIQVKKNRICLNHLLSVIIIGFADQARIKNLPIRLKKTLENKESTIISDQNRLSKIIFNLIENALKFTPRGSIEVGYYLSEDQKNIHIYVKDTGIGIKEENQKMIFRKFSKAKVDSPKSFQGLGLGLPIALENANLLNGRIDLNSIYHEGSTFTLCIPYKISIEQKEEELVMELQ